MTRATITTRATVNPMPVTIKGAKELATYMRAAAERVDPVMRALNIELAQDGTRLVRQRARTGRPNLGTGALAKSIKPSTPRGAVATYTSFVGTNKPYANLQEYGSAGEPGGVHTVNPDSGAQVLHFIWHGYEFFRPWVNIPGRPYFRPGFDELRDITPTRVKSASREIMAPV